MSMPWSIFESGKSANYLQRNFDIVRLFVAKRLAEKGFILEPLEKAVEREWVRKLLWKALPAREGIVKGAFVYVPPNTQISAPLSMCFVVDRGAQWVHNVLFIGDNSEVTVSTTCLSAGGGEEHQGFTEVYLGRGAKLDYITIHGWSKQTSVVAEVGVVAEEGSTMNELYVTLRTPQALRSFTRIVGGRRANILSSTLYVAGAGNSTLETYVALEEGASAEVLSRIVATRGAIVRQPITVEARGGSARGHIECRGLQLDPSSVIETIPALRSLHGGAQLTHEAAIGKLSQEELEYLMSKGFSEDEAVTLLVRGFLELGIKSLPEALKPQVAATLDLIAKAAKG
ncbi:MAG: SufD family Fe-S cluster assembly protein [Thermofilaceae archaeon]